MSTWAVEIETSNLVDGLIVARASPWIANNLNYYLSLLVSVLYPHHTILAQDM